MTNSGSCIYQVLRIAARTIGFVLSALPLTGFAESAKDAETVPMPGLVGPVQVALDEYAIPHIYAQTWEDASRVLGYLHASQRLWQMDMLRRQASGCMAEIIGPDGVPSDQLMRQLGIRRSCQQMWDSGQVPAQMRAELEAYAAGVNQKIGQLGKQNLPAAFQVLDYQPRLWEPVDSLVFSKYMGWDQSGTLDDLWLGGLVEKLGPAVLEELWPIERPYEIPTVTVQSHRKASDNGVASANEIHDKAIAAASTGQGWLTDNVGLTTIVTPEGQEFPEVFRAYGMLYQRLNNVGWMGRGGSFGSNNWAVSGSKTKSGKPMVCSDPHLGFTIPSLWYSAHLSVQGENIAGVTFPGAPTVVIGHNDRIAWGLTNMQADAVDFYVEKTDPMNPQRYFHRGQWKNVERQVETISVRGAEPQELVIEHTIHGPILQREPAVISLCWTGLGPTTDSVALWKISRAKNLDEFLSGLDDLQVPAMNVVYGDVDGNIAIHCCGRLPLRTRGQGRVPMDGSTGQHDWVGWIPRDQLPLSINPSEQFVASANGRPHPVGYPHYLGWMWDPSYRTRRIKSLLSQADNLTIESMKPIQFDHFDEAASRFLPTMLKALEQPLGTEADRMLIESATEAIRQWDYIAHLDSPGPTIWLRWLEKYRDNVWQDLWEVHGVPQQSGSWGFTGDNRREPVLEVLEYLTLEMPNSHWFDDLRTAERETRNDLLRKSFVEAISSLKQQLGAEPRTWVWKNVNVLRIDSLAGDPRLNVDGGPVVGDIFTLNPGGNVGPVAGGASWRMIVDFGNLTESVGVYPGGQSENPMQADYADQVPLWTSGQYTRLHAVGSLELLPESAKRKQMIFQ